MKFKIRSTCIATVAHSVDEVHTARGAVAKQMQVIQLKEKKSKYRNSNGGASIFSNRSTCIATVAQGVDEVHTARDAVAKQMQVIQ